MKVKKNRLSDMDYDEVSLVDVGAGEGAHVTLFKRDTQEDSENPEEDSVSSDGEAIGKGSLSMATEVVEKRAGKRECAECGSAVPKDEMECPDCGSSSIKKSIIIVRKEVTDESVSDEELGDALEAVEDEDEEDPEVEDDEEDDEEEEPVVEKSFTDAESMSVSIDALSIAADLAQEIAKAFQGGITKDTPAQYESAMTKFNEVMDEAAEGWLAKSLTDGTEIRKKAGVVRQQITDIIKQATEGGVMTTRTRPASLDGLELPAEVAEYVSGLEEDAGIQKNDIYKGLSPEVVEVVKNAERIVEENETAKWLDVAKKFDRVPGDKAELAKSLRVLHNTDKPAYDALVKSLEGANEAAKSGDITKSYGLPGGGEPSSAVEKRRNEAKEMVEKGLYPTIEQAEVALLRANPQTYNVES